MDEKGGMAVRYLPVVVILFLAGCHSSTPPTPALKSRTADAEAAFAKGQAAAKDKDPDLAIAYFNQTIGIDPAHAKAWWRRGIARGLKNQHEAAIIDLSEAIRIDPSLVGAYVSRGTIYALSGSQERANADWAKAEALDPEYVKKVFADAKKESDAELDEPIRKAREQLDKQLKNLSQPPIRNPDHR